MSANPARWHADPTGRHELRFWDGSAWTPHVSDGGLASVDPIGTTRPTTGPGDPALTPTSEGRSTPATHEPVSPTPGVTRRTQPFEEPAASTAPISSSRPSPIVTRAGWSQRTKLLVGFLAIDAVVVTAIIWFVVR